MRNPYLSILIPTCRGNEFNSLMGQLHPQILSAPPYSVEVIAYPNLGHDLGFLRQKLLQAATGEYTVFIDDDDRISITYVEEILAAIREEPDYIGFDVAVRLGAGAPKIAHHSLKHGSWYETGDAYYRDICIVNPVKRRIALEGNFCRDSHFPEDYNWVEQVRPYVRTEVYLPRVLYFYDWRPGNSVQDNTIQTRSGWSKSWLSQPYFKHHPLVRPEPYFV